MRNIAGFLSVLCTIAGVERGQAWPRLSKNGAKKPSAAKTAPCSGGRQRAPETYGAVVT